MRLLISLLVIPVVLCIGNQRGTAADPSPWKRLDGQTLVFVAGGAGGNPSIGESLLDTVRREGVLLHVQPVAWSRYNNRVWDYSDQEAHHAGACYIAKWVRVIHAECPNSKIILVGYSTGANVVLPAAALCPQVSLHRIVLLAPAVSCAYDLRPALKATRYGIDSFYSSWDGVLEMAAQRMGTADGQWTETAGRVGFWPRNGIVDPMTVSMLRQHHWREGMGGHGGHLSWTTTTFQKGTLIPLLLTH